MFMCALVFSSPLPLHRRVLCTLSFCHRDILTPRCCSSCIMILLFFVLSAARSAWQVFCNSSNMPTFSRKCPCTKARML
ncbi:hypothetical protein BDR07DRAFT_1427668, partial [Suillus spraguei]